MFYVACSVTYMLFFLWGVFLPFLCIKKRIKRKVNVKENNFGARLLAGLGGGIYLMICYAFQVVNTKYIISGPSFT